MLRPFVSIFQMRIERCNTGQYRANTFASKHPEETDPSELLWGMKRQEATRCWLWEAFCSIVCISFQIEKSLRLPFQGVQTEHLWCWCKERSHRRRGKSCFCKGKLFNNTHKSLFNQMVTGCWTWDLNKVWCMELEGWLYTQVSADKQINSAPI